MTISVVTATYRREDPLRNALDSLTKQTFKDFEAVVVDDNADKEWNAKVEGIVSEFKDKLNLVYIVNETNCGSAASRNKGVGASKGEYVTFLDDDDLYLPEKLSVQVKQMIKDEADYSLMDLTLYNEDETLSEIRTREYLSGPEKDNLLLCHMKYHMTGTDTMMFRKDYFLSFGGFGTMDSGDEFYLMLAAIEKGGKLSYCNTSLVKAYVHTGENGLSSGKKKVAGENALFKFKKKYYDRIDLKSRRYINMRHYAVLAFAYKRMNKPLGFLFNGVLSAMASPLQCLKLLKNLKQRKI